MTNVSRLVSPEEFAAAMTARWHSLGNTSSRKLRQLWSAMAATFARAIADSHTAGTKWRVLEPPTGTGKTQGLCVFSALAVDKNRHSAEPLGILCRRRPGPLGGRVGLPNGPAPSGGGCGSHMRHDE